MKPSLLLILMAAIPACSNASDTDPDASPFFADAEPSPTDATPKIDAEPERDDDAGEVPVSLRINEVLKNSPGPDDTHEFIEVFGGANLNLSDFSLVVLEGDIDSGSTVGVVDMLIDLGTTNGDGFYVTEFFGDEIENGSLTILLVRGLDPETVEGADLDTDDDGQLDTTPWQELVDSVALIDDPLNPGYSPNLLTDDLGGEDEEFVGASRFPDGMNTGAVTDWVRANSEGVGLEDLLGAGGAECDGCGDTPARPGRAVITPGASNEIVSAK